MTQKQILKKLIAHYSMVIGLCQKEKKLWVVENIMEEYSVNYGLCRAAMDLLKKQICKEKWVLGNVHYADYWNKPPINENTVKRKIKSLQYRLDKMNEILNSLNKK